MQAGHRILLSLVLVVATVFFFAAPAARAEFTCTCESTEETGCTRNSDLPQRTPLTSATSLDNATVLCRTMCQAALPGTCLKRYSATAPSSPNSTTCLEGSVCLTNPLSAKTVPELIANILKAAIGVVGALALLVFVYGGFIWLTSGGESAKVSAGKEAMKWAAVGLVVIFTSYGLVSFVFSAIKG
jgi:hypothetical protein